MKASKLFLTTILSFGLIAGVAAAQERSHSPSRTDSSGDRGDRGGTGGYRSESQPSHSTQAPVPSSNNTVTSSGGSYYSGSPGYYYNFDASNLYARNFLYALWQQYPFIPVHLYIDRYAIGDSPIDRNLLRLALQDSYEASGVMTQRINELSRLIDSYEAGTLDKKAFQKRFDASIDDIRKLSRNIRKDQRLSYLDQRRGTSTSEPAAARTIPELKELVAELRIQVGEMRQGLENYYTRDYTRVIELDHLKQPSFRSISDRIDKIAKVAEKSASRM
jgi:hypothetical protein